VTPKRRYDLPTYICVESFNCFICDTKPSESSVFIIIMYQKELTPKSYELIMSVNWFIYDTKPIESLIIGSRTS
jgi:hypothetical protein